MVAGSAFANDYDWAGLDSPKTDANHNVVINGKATDLKYENKKFTFNVNPGDQITLGVKGENLNVAVDGAPLTAKLEGGLIHFDIPEDKANPTKKMSVELTLGDKTAITSIYVESSNYRLANDLIKNVGMAAINKATVDIADYSTMIDKDNQNL